MIGLSPLSAGHRRRFQPTCVRPSTGSYPRFSLPTDSSPGFASAARDSSRPVKARFRYGSLSVNLAPRQRLAGSFYKRHAVTPRRVLRLLVGARFQVLFHSPPGVLFTFPSRYWYAIGQTGMLRLTQRSGLIHAGFHEARATWDNTIGRRLTSRYGAGTLYGQAFKPVPLASRFMTPARPVGTGTRDPTTPATQPPTGITRNRFGLIRFRSPLLTEYPFLQVLRCFTSPGWLLWAYIFSSG